AAMALNFAIGESHTPSEGYAALVSADKLDFFPSAGSSGVGKQEIFGLGVEPLFVTRGATGSNEFGVGYRYPETQLVYGRLDNAYEAFEMIQDSGCATTPISAAALRTQKGYWVAFTSSRKFGSCMNDDGTNGPATVVQVAELVVGKP